MVVWNVYVYINTGSCCAECRGESTRFLFAEDYNKGRSTRKAREGYDIYSWLRSQTHAALENEVNESQRALGWRPFNHVANNDCSSHCMSCGCLLKSITIPKGCGQISANPTGGGGGSPNTSIGHLGLPRFTGCIVRPIVNHYNLLGRTNSQ